MFNTFDELARKILIRAKEEMYNLKHPYVGSEHLLLSILKNKNEISNKLKEYDLTYKKFKEELINIVGVGTKQTDCFLYTPLLKRILETSMIDSRENNNGVVTINHLFSALLEEGEGIAIRIMLGMNIDLDILYKEFTYKVTLERTSESLNHGADTMIQILKWNGTEYAEAAENWKFVNEGEDAGTATVTVSSTKPVKIANPYGISACFHP